MGAGVGSGRSQISKVKWTVDNGTLPIPLQSPVSHCAAATVGDDGCWILAGGNSEDLQVYAVGAEGSIQRIPTDGARLLPPGFANGMGSWPIADGRRLLMFAYQQGNAVQFRAVDFSGRILALRALPENATGFQAEFLGDSNEVRVTFGGEAEPLVFGHPDAPKVTVTSARVVEFGVVKKGRPASRRVTLRNDGRREAIVRAATDQEAFRLVGPSEWALGPGAEAVVLLEFAPSEEGAASGRLELTTNTPAPDGLITVLLRGLVEPSVAEPAPVPVAPELAPPADPVLGHVEWEDHANGARDLRGVLLASPLGGCEEPVAVLLEDEAGRLLRRWPVGADGGFAGRLEEGGALGGNLRLRVEGVSGRRSPGRVPLPPAGPRLVRRGDDLVVAGPPRQQFRIAVVVEVAGRPPYEFASWVGRLDGDGEGVLPVAALGALTEPVVVVAWCQGVGGWVGSPSLVVRP